MSEDLSFQKILDLLKEIHEEFPGMRFGQVLQVAMDENTLCNNTNFFDRSSKKIFLSLSKYHEKCCKQKERAKGKGGKK